MEKSTIAALVAQYETLLENYELQPDNHSSRALKAFLEEYPNIGAYDRDGSYIGPVRNENGWIP